MALNPETDVHLHVLVHGMWGNPTHLSEAARVLSARFEAEDAAAKSQHAKVEILIASTNAEEGTYDGIDWGGERVVEEIDEKVEELKRAGRRLVKFSCTGYSLGGLIARYAVGILFQRNFFDDIERCNFQTIASPWIGLVRYNSLLSGVMSSLGPKMLGRTGPQFYLADVWSTTGKPLIEVMADPNSLFYRALTGFNRIAVYGNALHDLTVPYATCMFPADMRDPFAGYDEILNDIVELELDPVYAPLLKSFTPREKAIRQPRPKMTWKEWIVSLKPQTIPGPFREWRFPLNMAIIAILPILFPIFIVSVAIRFSRETRKSRFRIRHLEEKDKSSMRQRLVSMFGAFEKDMEQAAEDFVQQGLLPLDDPTTFSSAIEYRDDPSASYRDENDATAPLATSAATSGTSTPTTVTSQSSKGQPVLSPVQQRIIGTLNKLPRMEKYVAFIHPVRNSHGAIVCRTMSMVEHRRGAGVVKHWADHFLA